jgi:hypothetical protein
MIYIDLIILSIFSPKMIYTASKRLFILVWFLLLFFWFSMWWVVRKSSKDFDILKITLDDYTKVVVNASKQWTRKSLLTLNKELKWSHAINWSMFCPSEYSRCSKEPDTSSYIRIVWWNHSYSLRRPDIYTWRAIFWFDYNLDPLFLPYFQTWKINKILYGISWPLLLYLWKDLISTSPLISDIKQNAKSNKTFICSKVQDKKNIIIMWFISSSTLVDLPKKIKNLFSCQDAILLDNWNSKSMIYNWKYIYWPWRDIMDAFVVIQSK